jgi:hypothetical protein
MKKTIVIGGAAAVGVAVTVALYAAAGTPEAGAIAPILAMALGPALLAVMLVAACAAAAPRTATMPVESQTEQVR